VLSVGTGAVGSAEIADGAVAAVDLGTAAVGVEALGDGAVTFAKLVPGLLQWATVENNGVAATIRGSSGQISVSRTATGTVTVTFGSLASVEDSECAHLATAKSGTGGIMAQAINGPDVGLASNQIRVQTIQASDVAAASDQSFSILVLCTG